ncbi:exodeoxyribonuclease VII small subunit [Marinicella rhabdoformis]|uniref:exodeoxyribonuclease VII small subunit n=1 Tax=Marinicella rhabdoformis TaxID=2580566 RepID=UPI0012AED900|nr:exodeoxyribonuclease VII small subunit [Marinicella rhabdoformis]
MSQSKTFEAQLQELNKIIEQMEDNDVGLEASLKLYEQGVKLTRSCQKIILEAEQKIQKLMDQNSESE